MCNQDNTEQEWESEMWDELHRMQRKIFWQLFATMLWGKYDNGKRQKDAIETLEPFWRYWLYRRLCALAMLLGRSHHDNDGTKSYDYQSLAWANSYSDGYGYSYDIIAYNPKAFRFHQYNDGEFTY